MLLTGFTFATESSGGNLQSQFAIVILDIFMTAKQSSNC
jgi:hypothetical protein